MLMNWKKTNFARYINPFQRPSRKTVLLTISTVLHNYQNLGKLKQLFSHATMGATALKTREAIGLGLKPYTSLFDHIHQKSLLLPLSW